MKLTNAQIITIAEAHLNLDGLPEKPFEFSARFRYALSKNLRLLQQKVRDIEAARVRIIAELAPSSLRIEKDAPEQKEYSMRYESILNEEVEIPNLMGLKLSDLNLERNDIPVRVLSALGPILVEDVEFS